MKKAETIFKIAMFVCISVASLIFAIGSLEDSETKLKKKELLDWQIKTYQWDNEQYIRAIELNQ